MHIYAIYLDKARLDKAKMRFMLLFQAILFNLNTAFSNEIHRSSHAMKVLLEELKWQMMLPKWQKDISEM